MTKDEISLIILKVTADGQDAINIKLYKNGTTCRYGVGGLPQLGISGMSFFNHSNFFDPLIEKLPEEILNQPVNYEEPTPNGYLEYVMAFYGVSLNGETGEDAEWSKSVGVRVKLDHQTTFRHPIMGLLDGLTMDAAELTNEWYFDIIMHAVYKAKSSTLPGETIITTPKTEVEINDHYSNYVNQMVYSARKWSMKDFTANKTYEIEGRICKGVVMQENDAFSVTFFPINSPEVNDEKPSKPKWKFW
jgi:hypothetical protein